MKKNHRLTIHESKSVCDAFTEGLTLDAEHVVEIYGLISPKIRERDGNTQYLVFNKPVEPFDDDEKFGPYCKFIVTIELDSVGYGIKPRIVTEDKKNKKVKKYPNYFGTDGDDSVLFEWYGKNVINDNKTYFNFEESEENITHMEDNEMHYECRLNKVTLFLIND